MDRRTFVRLSGVTATTAGVSGCVGDGDNEGDDEPEPGGDQNRTQQDDGETEDNETQEQDTETEMNGENGLVTQTAEEETVDEAVERITSDIGSDENPLSLLYQLDHRENAANVETVDLDLPPTVVIMFGNPAAGTPLMRESRTIGVDLPQKMLVWDDDDGEVKITYNDPEHLAERHGIEGQQERLGKIRDALDNLAAGNMG